MSKKSHERGVSQPVIFMADTLTYEGLFVPPETEGGQVPGIVICHPHPLRGGDMLNNVVSALAEAFAAVGFAVLHFNFRGVGRSTGRYAEGIGEQDDAKAAMTWLMTRPGIDTTRLLLAGYSFGARVTLGVASTDPRVGGFIAVAPPVLRSDWPSLDSARGPKLFFCGEHDPVAPPKVLMGKLQLLLEPKKLVVVPGADHFFLGQEHTLAQYAVNLVQEVF